MTEIQELKTSLRGAYDSDVAIPFINEIASPVSNWFAKTYLFHLSAEDRKSTRPSHQIISYAVFCLKKKKTCKAEKHSTAARTRIDSVVASDQEPHASPLVAGPRS